MKILCYGDSNTYGYDPRTFGGDRYPAQCRWADILGQKLGCEVVNAGENGREIPRREAELRQFDRLVANQAPVSLMIMMLGTNDLLQGNSAKCVANRMESFLRRMDLDRICVLLVAPPPLKLGEWVPAERLIVASEVLNLEYESLARRLGVHYVDAGEWQIPLAFDGVHFTEAGHCAFAEGIHCYLNKEKIL